jgi:hypothetical protein
MAENCRELPSELMAGQLQTVVQCRVEPDPEQ